MHLAGLAARCVVPVNSALKSELDEPVLSFALGGEPRKTRVSRLTPADSFVFWARLVP